MTTIVPYDPALHEALVYGTWLSTYASAPSTRGLSRDAYYGTQRCVIDCVLARAVTLVADDEGLLLGFGCAERVAPRVVAGHYLFLKPRDRGLGLGHALMRACAQALDVSAEDRVVVTHSAKPFSDWIYRKGWRYEPQFVAGRRAVRAQ